MSQQRSLLTAVVVFCMVAMIASEELALSELNAEMTDTRHSADRLRRQTNRRARLGTVYTRWGKAICPDGTETVYSGTLGGSYFTSPGGAANHLCLPPNPVYDNHTNPQYTTRLYGGEYEANPEKIQDLNVQCAVCRTPRTSSIMIPATNTCPAGWILEYSGYLMAGYFDHASSTEFVCVDPSFDYVPGSQGNENGRLLYYTVSMCTGLKCPPYENNKSVLCVVCSK